MVTVAQLDLITAFAHRRPAPNREPPTSGNITGWCGISEYAAAEIAAALRHTPRGADLLLDTALGLAQLPATTAAFRAGDLDLRRVRTLHDAVTGLPAPAAVTGLPAPAAAAVEAAVTPSARAPHAGRLHPLAAGSRSRKPAQRASNSRSRPKLLAASANPTLPTPTCKQPAPTGRPARRLARRDHLNGDGGRDLRMQPHRDGVGSERLDRGGQLKPPLVEHRSASCLDGSGDVGDGHRTEEAPALSGPGGQPYRERRQVGSDRFG